MDHQQLYTLIHKRYTYHDGYLLTSAGVPIGTPAQDGSTKTTIYKTGKRYNYSVHRLIFLYHFGHLPETIDHINGIRTDNRIENLRAATYSENNRNRPVSKYSTSQCKGVHYNRRNTKPWNVRIRIDGKMRSLGYYHTIEEANVVYQAAAEKYYGEFAFHLSRLDT